MSDSDKHELTRAANDAGGGAAQEAVAALRTALTPLEARIDAAFIYGPLVKGAAEGEIELVILGTGITHREVLPNLIAAAKYLGRRINPAIYRAEELEEKLSAGNRAVLALMKQRRVFVIGSEADVPQLH